MRAQACCACRAREYASCTSASASTVTIVGKDGSPITHPRKRFGQRSIDYRHYLPELAKLEHNGVTGKISFDGKGGELTIHYTTLEQLDELCRRLKN